MKWIELGLEPRPVISCSTLIPQCSKFVYCVILVSLKHFMLPNNFILFFEACKLELKLGVPGGQLSTFSPSKYGEKNMKNTHTTDIKIWFIRKQCTRKKSSLLSEVCWIQWENHLQDHAKWDFRFNFLARDYLSFYRSYCLLHVNIRCWPLILTSVSVTLWTVMYTEY